MHEIVHIKKIIVENFLSFQRDEINFGDSNFIIIIGPNWSGKTSIYQAIKFALGSNERDERYKKWSDFIRNGQDHAMVELHIQIDNQMIKIRRLVIRGQSPFFEIEHKDGSGFKKIQAIEIQNLISELKINPDNQFAFVSQGKIDAIKSLKPEELSSFLEEGIGLKGLRDEILLQKRNINSLNKDFQSLISKKNTLNLSFNLLQPKLERLKQKNRLLEVKRGYEDELLYANRKLFQEKIFILEQKIENLQLEIDDVKKHIKKNEKLIGEKASNINAIDKKINDHSKKIGELNFQKKELVIAIQKWQKEKINIKKELDELNKEITKLEKYFSNYKMQKDSLEKEIKIIKNEITSIRQEIDNLIKEQNELTAKIEQNKEFLNEYNNLIFSNEEYQRKIKDNKHKIKDINFEINEIFQSFKDIEHKLEKNKWFLENPTQNLSVQLDNKINTVSSKLFEMGTKIRELNFEKSKQLNKFKLLQTSLKERRIILPPNINIIKEEIEKRELKNKVKGPIIEYLKYDDEISYAIESVLGERLLYSFLVKDWDTLQLLNRLKNKYNAYCNIYIPKNLNISPLPKFLANGVIGYLAELIKVIENDIDIQKVIYSKVKNCLVVKDYRSGMELYRMHNFKGKCVTLKGEQIVSYKYVYETPYLKRLKGLMSVGTQKEQLDILESEINSLNKQISELRAEQSKLDASQKELFRKKESFNDLLYNFNQKRRLTSKKNQLYEIIYNLEENSSDLQDKIDGLTIKISNLESQRNPEFFKWSDRIREIPTELNLHNEESKKWDLKLNENIKTLNDVIEKVEHYNNKLNLQKSEYQNKKDLFQKSDKKAFEIYRKLEVVDEDLENIEKNIVKLNKQKSIIQKEKFELEKKHIQIKINLEQEHIKLTTLKQELTFNKNNLERINSEVSQLILENKIEDRPIEEIKDDIMKLDKELLKYFDVDDSILVEKEQILAGLKEISKNQMDLEKDINSAIKTENKMEKTYYNKFKIVLDDLQSKINQKFKVTNIKAYCSLNLIGNFEELGVEIKAATSKDKLKSFTALSGGQISLISICLILALQEIKPSPLCMFDEAGMFLDEKNSEASYQMIKSTLDLNPIQLLMFLPKSSNSLYLLADKLIGVARTGRNEVSTIFNPKIIKEKS